MNIINKCIKKLFFMYRESNFFANMSDETYIKLAFRACMGYRLNLNNPKTYNEKLQWLKLFYHNSKAVSLVDKYEVKRIVSEIIGEDYLIPTYGVWNSFEEIDFSKLPEQFVLKCTHDSGGLVICKDKKMLNIDSAREKLETSLKSNYFLLSREWPYKNVKPRIIAEKYMEDQTYHELRDYKFFCFDGEPKVLFVATDRMNKTEETKFDFFDMDYNWLDFRNGHPNASRHPQKPDNFEEMRIIAEKLSAGFPHMRVDLYDINGKVYFGELTFSHWGGLVPFEPNEWDYRLGKWIKLPKKEI